MPVMECVLKMVAGVAGEAWHSFALSLDGRVMSMGGRSGLGEASSSFAEGC